MRPFLPAILFACACTSSSNDLEFEGSIPLLADYSYDTGPQPSSGPVQVQFQFSAGGSLNARAQAIAGGDGEATAVAAVPGSGTFKLDAHFKAVGTLHVDVSGMKYDGPIPGIENIDIAFGGETAFDPFLMDGSAMVTASIPETKLPDIPLPGGLPGHLELTIAEGSTMSSELAGTCAAFEGKTMTYKATTQTSAKIVLKSKVVLQVPVVGDKPFDLPSIDIPVPAFSADLDLGAREFVGGGTPPTGTLAAPDGCDGGKGDGPDGPDDPNGGGGGGGGVCEAVDGAYDAAWHPPTGLRQNQCTDSALNGFAAACTGANATLQSCTAFYEANRTCYECIVTSDKAPGHGAVVVYSVLGSTFNLPGCLAAVAPGELQCAKNIQKAYACVEAACGGCADSSDAEINACLADAAAGACALEVSDLNNCTNRISANNIPGQECFLDFDYARRFCGP